jgi:hypothetical protein
MILYSYNGIRFASIGLSGGLTTEQETGPENTSNDLARNGFQPLHIGVTQGVKTLPVSFIVDPLHDLEQTRHLLLATFDPKDTTERPLVALKADGVPVVAYAALVRYDWDHPTGIILTFVFTDPVWRKLAPSTFGPLAVNYANEAILPVENRGMARENLIVTIKPTGHNDVSTDGSFQYRRSFTVSNNGDSPLTRYPYELSLGDTTGWGGGAFGAYPHKLTLMQDGLIKPCTPINFQGTASYLWFLIDQLAPGDTVTYDLVYWSPTLSPIESPTLSGLNFPAIDIDSTIGSSTSSTTATVTDTGATWETNEWQGGTISIGGQSSTVTGNTLNALSVSPAFSPAPSGAYLIRTSTNSKWIYRVQQTEHGGVAGLWYENRHQSKPSVIRFDNPGSWYRYLKNDNNDEKTQPRTSAIDVGTVDYFTILNAKRTVQGWARFSESGQADGVAFSSPIPITRWRFNYKFMNPNGIAKAFFGARESGAEDWEAVFEDTGTYQTLQNSGIFDTTFTDDMRHLSMTVDPKDDDQLPTDWMKDAGTWTGGGLSTFFDDTKTWDTDQWINARIRIVSGTGAGQVRTVSSNDSVHVVITANWTVNPSDDSRYEITNHRLVANVQTRDTQEIYFNTSSISVSAISAEVDSYAIQTAFTLGSIAAPSNQYIEVSRNGRWILCTAAEELRIDGARRRATCHLSATGELMRDVSTGVVVEEIFGDESIAGGAGSLLAPEWLVLQPGANILPNPSFATDLSGWAFISATAGVTHTDTRDAAVFSDAAGSLKLAITANTAAGAASVVWSTPTGLAAFPVTAGNAYIVIGSSRTTNVNWVPLLQLTWYDINGALLSTAVQDAYVPDATTWARHVLQAMAPADAAFAAVSLVASTTVGGATGTVNFDDLWIGGNMLAVDPNSFVSFDLSASGTEGYYG